MEYTITYYLNTACRERRPETNEDIKNDWKVVKKEFDTDIEAYEFVLTECLQLDEEEIADIIEGTETDIERIEAIQDYFDNQDPSDGSILLIKIEGPEQAYDFGFEEPEIEDEDMEDLLNDLIYSLNNITGEEGLLWDANEIYDNCAITEDEESDQYMEVFVYRDENGNVRYSTDEEHADSYETVEDVYNALMWKSY